MHTSAAPLRGTNYQQAVFIGESGAVMRSEYTQPVFVANRVARY
jgi:hypothetical protein